MFEKEAEERTRQYASKHIEKYNCENTKLETDNYNVGLETGYEAGFQDGAEFGYNKANEWIYMKDINSDEEFDKHRGGKLYVWEVKTFNDEERVEFEGFHAGSWDDLVYETYAYQVKCFKKIEPPKEDS